MLTKWSQFYNPFDIMKPLMKEKLIDILDFGTIYFMLCKFHCIISYCWLGVILKQVFMSLNFLVVLIDRDLEMTFSGWTRKSIKKICILRTQKIFTSSSFYDNIVEDDD